MYRLCHNPSTAEELAQEVFLRVYRSRTSYEPSAKFISGSDLGFQIDQRKGNAPVGTLVVRVNGQWVEAEFSVGIKRITK
jgi:hypothetical protein